METARLLGRSITDQHSFASECEVAFGAGSPLAKEFQMIGKLLFTTDDGFGWATHNVWNSLLRTAFFLEQPLNLQLMKIHGDHQLLNNPVVLDFLDDVLHAIDPDGIGRIACGILPAICDVLLCCRFPQRLCSLLLKFAENEECREMMCDDTLFQSLRRMMQRSPHNDTVISLIVAQFVHSPHRWAALSVFRLILFRSQRSGPGAIHDVLASLLTVEAWRVLLLEDFKECTDKEYATKHLGFFWVGLLTTEVSSAILVHMHTGHTLDRFVARCAVLKETDLTWAQVWVRVRRMWPSRVNAPPSDPCSTQCCPITLSEFRVPVLATDGHTYELDALLTHFSFSGFVSPLTKDTVSYQLVENFGVKDQ